MNPAPCFTLGEILVPAWLRRIWQKCWIYYRFKFVLPRINKVEIEGIHLDLTSFSPRVRNRILLGYEESEKAICRQLLRRNDSVLELGSGIGFIGLFCMIRIGIAKYISVEANPNTIDILERNYRLNGLRPTVLNYAINDQSGTVDLNVDGDFWEHRLELNNQTGARIAVPGGSLLELLRTLPFCPTTLIIDVEGAEQFINFREIPEEIRKIIIEIHPVIIGHTAAQEIIGALRDSRFQLACQEENILAFTKGI